MKRKIFAITIILVLLAGIAVAQEAYMRVTATKTADAAIMAGPGLLHGIVFVTDGTNAVTVNVYDNASAATGTKLLPTDTIITTSSANRVQAIGFDPPINCINGAYVDVTVGGGGSVAYMGYYSD